MPLTMELVEACVRRYVRELDRYSKLAEFVAEKCRREVVEAKAVRATVTWRAKSPKRFEGKLAKYMEVGADASALNTEEEVFKRISDLAGVRISTYLESDREKVVAVLEQEFAGPDDGKVVVDKKDKAEHFYRATHCQVALAEDDLVGRYENLEDLSCEVQVTSLLAHVWNEIEHDLRYKPLTGQISEGEQEWLHHLGAIVKQGDDMIASLFKATNNRLAADRGPFSDVHSFIIRTRDAFPAATHFENNAWQLYDALMQLKIDSLEKLRAEFLCKDYEVHALTVLNNFNQVLIGTGFQLDEKSSDLLLVLVLEKYANRILGMYPAGYGQGRPARIRSLAYRWK